MRAVPLGVATERNKVSTIFGLSGVRVLPLGVAAERSVEYYFGIIFLLLFSARRGCPRVMKFCTEFSVTKKIRFGVNQKFGAPLAPWG